MIPIKPRNVYWSDEQWKAIHESGKSILVNAGAGSGKTAVLTQRIIEILKRGISLDRLIVLTFTKAAAREMKERVRKALIKYSCDDSNLKSQLDYLDQAAIQTFDAFALSLVKRYHYLLGVDKSITIGDNVILEIKRKQIIDEVFNELYEEGSKDFLDFVALFALKKDDILKSNIYNLCTKVDLLTNSEEFLDSYFSKFYNHEYLDEKVDEFINLIKFDLDRIKLRLNNIEKIVTDEKLVKHYEGIRDSLADLLAVRTYKGILENIDVSIPRMPSKADEDEKIKVDYEKKQIKDLIDKLKKVLTFADIDEIKTELLATKNYVKVIIRIIKEVEKRFLEFKNKRNIYGFLDIAKLAIKIFKENSDLKDYYKNYIYEILIDEYQDTSDIQEELINEISNNNVYMVGDVKQSIYRFRNANPEIFKNKYATFKTAKDAIAIDLSKNFRSRKEVLKNINDIFSKVMSLDLGGVDYDLNHALQFGNLKYDKNAINNYDLDIYTYDYSDDSLTATEKEAFIVANDIKMKMAEKYKIYDKDNDCIRDCKYSDFTILVSQKDKFELYKKIFEYMQIPLVIHKDEDFVRSSEIYVIKNILRAVYSLINYDYYLNNFKDAIYSILRSFLIEASDEEISLIFMGNLKEGLILRFPLVYDNLINIARMVEKSTLSEILGEIYQIFDIYVNIVKLGNVEEVENKLNFLLSKFKELDSNGYTLADAIKYLEVLMEEGYDIEASEVIKIDESSVNIMTIHKSKGLEFPVCYFVELGSRFKVTESNDRIIFDKDYGFILPIFKEGLKDTILKSLLKSKYLIEEISERLRVFYVALTRAKEKIIIVCEDFNQVEDYYPDIIPYVERLNYNSFYAVLNSLRRHLRLYKRPTLVNGSKDYLNTRKIAILSKDTPLITLKSVNVGIEEVTKKIASSASSKLNTKEEIKKLEFGTLVHEYFELIDFKSDINKQLEKVNINNLIKNKIYKFYNLDIFKESIVNVYHEYQFSYNQGNINTKGIIDLIIEYEDKIYIIDFKLSELEKEEYKKQLQVYYDYLKMITNKQINAYLYSIIKEELKLIIEGESYELAK